MQNVMTEINDWAPNLPYWEQAALDKLIFNEVFTEEDYQNLLKYLLEDEGLEEPRGERPPLRFHHSYTQNLDIQKPVKIKCITNLQNVNALVSQQTLEFGPNLTVVYGANGSGKSGYARVLGSAGFTRGDRDVLPDVTQPIGENPMLSADIEITIDGVPKTIHYQIGKACPELSSFYVFDSTSVHVHMCESNPLSFSPAGLSYLKCLANETDEVRFRLDKRIEECKKPPEFTHLFPGETEVSQLIENLGPDTDLDRLHELAHLTVGDRRRKAVLGIEIGKIELDQIRIQKDNLRQKIRELADFKDRLVSAQQMLNREENVILQDIEAHLHLKQLSERFGVENFQGAGLSQTGTDVWQRFIHAARALAESESVDGQTYPGEDSRCLLCHQPLSPSARGFILRLWEFLDGEYQSKLASSESGLRQWNRRIYDLRLFILDEELSSPYKHLAEDDPELLHKTQQLVQAYRHRRDILLQSIEKEQAVVLPPLPENCIPSIEALLNRLRDQLSELENKNLEEEKEKLENEKKILEHRETLANIYPEVRKHIEMLNWARRASQVGGSTHHITSKHNSLFNELVTEEYKKLFEQTLKNLGRPLKIKVKTQGKKGDTLKQIILEVDRTASNIAKPEKVLSEGEKRAVALADFLTEAALDTTSSGIILDDPVTSLDLEWRVTIADILADEALRRQVIVFTHDLPFVYFLKSKAEEKSLLVSTHWIRRGDTDNRPGYVSLNNSPALEREYRKASKARDFLAKAKNVEPAQQEIFLRVGFSSLRTSYEAFIIFDLFNEVVLRFGERISFGRLREIVWDPSIAEEVIESCERLSRYIEGHLHSDEFMPVKPNPTLLCEEIERFESLQARLKRLRKNHI